MRIDNSAANTFRSCPWKYYEEYLKEGTGLEPINRFEKVTPLELGSRVHELLEEHYKEMGGFQVQEYAASMNAALEKEAQWMMQKYKSHYPIEEFKILDVEKTFEVALPDYCPKCYSEEFVGKSEHEDVWPNMLYCKVCDEYFRKGRHSYTGKIDLFIKQDDKYYIIDHKTEKRSSKSNLPQKWAARDQATQYLWAAEKVYGVTIDRFIVNILRRPSEAGREGPEFPERQRIERTEIQTETALRDLVVKADEIEKYKQVFGDKPWPASRENCYTWGACDFYLPHLFGWSEAIRNERFQPKKEYLHLAGVPIIQ